MFCPNCGKEVEENAKFCPECGNPVNESGKAKEKKTESNINGNENAEKIDPPSKSITKSGKNKKRIWFGAAGIFVVMVLVVLAVAVTGTKREKEIVHKLQSFTELYQTDTGYAFGFQGEWELNYLEDDEFVRIAVPDATQYLAEIFGVSSLGDDGTCSYILDNGNVNIYCNDVETEEGSLSAITCNIEDGKFTFLIDGERYEPRDDFAASLEEYGIGDLLSAKVQYFEGILADNGLAVDEAAELSYDVIRDCVENGEIVLGDSESMRAETPEMTETPETIETPDDDSGLDEKENSGIIEEESEEPFDSQDITSENLLTDPVTMGWGGAYIDDDTGDRLVIAMIGYEYSYKMLTSSGEVFQQESGCTSDADYMSGQYYTFCKNENGLLGVTSGAGGVWGNYRRVSGTTAPADQIEGTYGDENTKITVSDQMASITDDYVPSGADIASVTVSYNNGLTIEGRLYTQPDGSVALVDTQSGSVQGILTFIGETVTAAGSGFDGTYQLSE